MSPRAQLPQSFLALGVLLGTALLLTAAGSSRGGIVLHVAPTTSAASVAKDLNALPHHGGVAPSSTSRPAFVYVGNVGSTDTLSSSDGSARTAFAGWAGRAVAAIALAALAVMGLAAATAPPAAAFANAAPEAALYRNEAKSPGTPPPDLGLLPRRELNGKPGLKACDGAPHCFSTSGPDQKHLVTPWLPPAGVSPESALAELKSVVERYPPYQQEIDGGGFQVVTSTPTYLYVQFESLKAGYIDDVEFAVNNSGEGILLRSSSRLGYLDLAVNAKRLNWISAELRKLGWAAPELTRQTHTDYFKLNNFEFLPF
eukprot:EG_transcript_16721